MDKAADYFRRVEKQFELRLEWDNRYIGQQLMQQTVLHWALEHRRDLSGLLRDSLIRSMQGALDAAMIEKPSLLPPALEGTCSDV